MRAPRRLQRRDKGADLSWQAVFLGASDPHAKRMYDVKPSKQPEIGRVRSLYMDCPGGGTYPRRGDRITTSTTLYFVLFARKVKRRFPNSCVRIEMLVIRAQDLTDGLDERLLRSAARDHLDSRIFSLFWYPRKKKRLSFESHMRRHAS
jgi:hypothetical protein